MMRNNGRNDCRSILVPGFGSSCEAAVKFNRSILVWEIDTEYHAGIIARMEGL